MQGTPHQFSKLSPNRLRSLKTLIQTFDFLKVLISCKLFIFKTILFPAQVGTEKTVFAVHAVKQKGRINAITAVEKVFAVIIVRTHYNLGAQFRVLDIQAIKHPPGVIYVFGKIYALRFNN
ncbi:hypothetical protein A2127_00055 [Candidatus Jorgensenbacteria bacterium GWC1_48_12]|uniref:Uncharacterized protein n=1 Tax=Candidatus Jorgensenbacteria bacterium GWC1_48_12 TaxID=1798469 RepID=A0A1F6BRM7_9BACT|nr:MAG: hypothetical protein A2127_00055 [Candidatus Jorgensenbacteria bacterium GWC1_48_12]